MKPGKATRAIGGVVLCAAGLWLAAGSPYHEQNVLLDAGGCRLSTLIVEPKDEAPADTVVLLHGLAANKKLMLYLARGLSAQGVRVFVPDLPGHGRTPGPFSPERAETCAEEVVKGLAGRGLINLDRTVIAGHSMGGAIAVQVAQQMPVAGVVAISPAPMQTSRGIWPEMLIYRDNQPLPPHTLLVSGGWEPGPMRGAAEELVKKRGNGTSKLGVIPRATHVSLLFDPRVIRASQDWTAKALHLSGTPAMPSRAPLAGFFLGITGLLLLAGPFLRETLGRPMEAEAILKAKNRAKRLRAARLLIEMAGASLAAVLLLRIGNPLRWLGLFEGDYLASFLLLTGVILLAIHHRELRLLEARHAAPPVGAAAGAVILVLLVTAWFDITLSEAWLTGARWLRFVPLVIAVLPAHAGEELLLELSGAASSRQRFAAAMALRLMAWGALMAGLFWLRDGQILMILLVLYFGVFSILQRLGMEVVRKHTGSLAAASLFGAILMAGFTLATFPVA